jgi:hypothetical protein
MENLFFIVNHVVGARHGTGRKNVSVIVTKENASAEKIPPTRSHGDG